MKEAELFREGTVRICGHLEIEDVLQACFMYFRSFFPIRKMYLHLEYPKTKTMNFIARAALKKAEQIDLTMAVPPEFCSNFNEYEKHVRTQGDQIFSFDKPDAFAKHIFEFLREPVSSAMGLGFVVGTGMPVCGVTVFAEGDMVFNDEQTHLLKILKEPFIFTLLNSMKYRRLTIKSTELEDENRHLQRELRRLSGDEIIGANFGLKKSTMVASQVASMDSPVLLLGETGAGKDVFANAIHYSSPRKDGPFIKVNCGAIPDSLIDSELFGHEKGAFTGAINQKRGCFERANKGTIFLDEVGELPLDAQVRFLRVLQEKQLERIGGEKTVNLDIRIIAATNRNLKKMVEKGSFRQDLWFRLNVFPITIPPLRERKMDIPALVQHFIDKKVTELKLPEIPEVTAAGMDAMINYDWPGNVRELANIVERSLILNPEGPLTFDILGVVSKKKPLAHNQQTDNIQPLGEVIANHICLALNAAKGKIHGKGGAAEILKINPNTLRSRIKKLGIEERN